MHNTLLEPLTQDISTEQSANRQPSWELDREERRIAHIKGFPFYEIGGGSLANIPVKSWNWCSCDSPLFKQRVSKRLQAFAKKYDGRTSAVLLGATGKGKTSAVFAALKRLHATAEADAIAKPGLEPSKHAGLCFLHYLRWHSGSQIALARKQFSLGKGEAELITKAINASILVVDECGFECQDGALFDVVDGRYMRGKPTVITTGLTVDAFKARYGDALLRRLTERGTLVEDFS